VSLNRPKHTKEKKIINDNDDLVNPLLGESVVYISTILFSSGYKVSYFIRNGGRSIVNYAF